MHNLFIDMVFMGTAVNNIQRAASMKGQAPTNNIINTININIIFFQGQTSKLCNIHKVKIQSSRCLTLGGAEVNHPMILTLGGTEVKDVYTYHQFSQCRSYAL
jgi:hypothetical protein